MLSAVWAGVSLALEPGWLFGKYVRGAELLASGLLDAASASDFSPGYLVLAWAFGGQGLRVFQAIAGAATIWLVWHTVRRAVSSPIALLAAAALASSSLWLSFSAVLEPDLLIGVCAALAIWALGAEKRWWAVVGAAAGAMVSLRPSGALFVVLLVPVVAGRFGLRRSLATLGVTVLVAAAPSIAIRAKAGSAMASTMSVGQVINQSHAMENPGFGATYPALIKLMEQQAKASSPATPPDYAHQLYRDVAAAALGTSTSAGEAEWYWLKLTAATALEHPFAFAAGCVRHLVFFVAPPQHVDIAQLATSKLFTAGLSVRWLALLGLAGVLCAGRSPAMRLWRLHWLSAALSAVIFYTQPRYLVSLLPTLAALTAAAAAACLALSPPRRRVFFGLGLTGLASVLVLALPTVREADEVQRHVFAAEAQSREALEATRAKQPREARAALEASESIWPDVWWRTIPLGLGIDGDDAHFLEAAGARAASHRSTAVDATIAAGLFAEAGACERAAPLALDAAGADFVWAIDDASIDPDLILSDCALASGNRVAAIHYVEASLAKHPGRLESLARAVAAADVGVDTERDRWQPDLWKTHDAASVHLALATARRKWGDAKRAIADAQWVRERLPLAAPVADFEIALDWLDLGDRREALTAYGRALQSRVPLHGARRFDPLVDEYLAARSDDVERAGFALAHWRLRGNRERVSDLLRQFPQLRHTL